ncbi:Arf family guanine nucleotide exchange factor SYT1 [Aspergillus clavatus NRRL 1]|uniref:Guanyl-nucleotide exchange factor, putative n=1 Tax=Aspergillus clavatus (strain ATCC 1007 / CBS 513.65 / DSM 816 / NCTC 3887 / NRRL 1 / QM 1276 / 107) TaxID=344612 RepID=A1CSU2_ASPCL|nr:guanyl-nucleotide exchange factor, putative [Aspergillus clavatus NRRL 1]EAW06379.1 guanyl-nucleotide exchange factor, putative [Aspergillus clavatus NRRL 1]
MHWKGLRLGAFDSNDSKRRSFVEPQALSRRSEHLPRPTLSTTNLTSRHSESAPRSPLLTGPEHEDDHGPEDHDAGNNETPRSSQTPIGSIHSKKNHFGAALVPDEGSHWRRNRFSFMRLRHASDPQLSKSYAKGEDVPPVPPLPPPPTIITTAPTSHELNEPVKKKPKFKILAGAKKGHPEGAPSSTSSQQNSPTVKSRHEPQGSAGSYTTDATLSTSKMSGEEPGRLSTTSIRSGGRDPGTESQRSSVADARCSESSRSDQSSGDHGGYHTHSPHEGAGSETKRFRMPRLKRNRAPLFPLPPRPTGASTMNGHGQDSQMSRAIPTDPGTSFDIPEERDQDRVSPLPSPSRSSAALASPGFPLLRNDSANSANSARSTPSIRSRTRPKTRPRSSTLDSLANIRDAGQRSPPPLVSSGRTSTSTSGRKSFGDIFSISQRLRQNSEPPIVRNGSPGLRGSDTPVRKLSYPERDENDTPATYLSRLEETIPKSAIAGVLCQSNEDFYKTALRRYMRRFIFFGDPIDMAIRKLLMGAELPKETQQIDRFLQSFANRYHECNPGIFASPDQAYFIAFSILILHTDVFNKNNKRKMQKPDYVRNTRGEGISDDILECIYENIAYTPFIHIEDTPPNGRQLAKPRRPLFKTASSEHLARVAREPVDPYTLIMDGKLESLRPSLKDVMNLEDPYQFQGPMGLPDIDNLHRAFTKSGILQIVSPRSRPDAFMPSSIDNPAADSNPGLVDIKVAKVGLLWRKDPKKKRARSPWQEWGALLTLSQLYFFRDINWIKALMAQHDAHQKEGRRRAVIFKPPLTEFKPDCMMSTEDAVALVDSSYKKHKNAFLFVRHNALEEVFLANSEDEMNDWLAKINYAATFRTNGVRAQGMIVTNYDAQRNRMSRKASVTSGSSHLSTDREPPSPNPDTAVAAELVMARRELMRQKVREANEKLVVSQKQLDDLLRNARHLQVLTPVTSRAREQVIMAAGRMAAKLKWVRQDLWRYKCYREVLLRDLGERDEEAKSLAEQRSLHLSIPARNPSISETGTPSQPLVDEMPSPTHVTSPQLPADEPSSVHRVPSSQALSADIRRPSMPISVTSSDLTGRVGRRFSVDTLKDRAQSHSPRPANRLQREPSVLSAASKMDVSSLGSRTSKLPSPISIDDNEERLLRDTGLLGLNTSPLARRTSVATHDKDGEQEEDVVESGQGEHMNRVRRSFHRTLRDSHQGHHLPRGKKPRDSISSMAAAEDDQDNKEGEGLSRKTPSFTVHGKKASIVTFGSEWQNMTPEERLKLRKPTPSEEPRASEPAIFSSGESIVSDPSNAAKPPSLRSASITTGLSSRGLTDSDGPPDMTGPVDAEDRKSKSENVLDLGSHIPPVDIATLAASSTEAVAGSSTVPLDQRSSYSAPVNDAAVKDNSPQKIQSSSPEQAVNA